MRVQFDQLQLKSFTPFLSSWGSPMSPKTIGRKVRCLHSVGSLVKASGPLILWPGRDTKELVFLRSSALLSTFHSNSRWRTATLILRHHMSAREVLLRKPDRGMLSARQSHGDARICEMSDFTNNDSFLRLVVKRLHLIPIWKLHASVIGGHVASCEVGPRRVFCCVFKHFCSFDARQIR